LIPYPVPAPNQPPSGAGRNRLGKEDREPRPALARMIATVRRVVVLAIMAALLVSCRSPRAPASGVSAPLPPGTILGVYKQTDSQHHDAAPVSGVEIGLYTERFVPGTLVLHPPEPIAVATTAEDGAFRFSNVRPGRYFLTPIAAKGWPGSAILRLTAARGARVAITGCSDCPPPQ
jgi:hypothetical protein